MNSSDSKVVAFPDLQEIEAEAAAWVARLESRESATAQRSELNHWLGRGPQYRDAFERMATLWGAADILDELNYLEHPQQGGPRSRRLPAPVWFSALAASLVLLVGYLLFTADGATTLQQAHFATAVGNQKSVTLRDGSGVMLNTNSAIDVALVGGSRDIRLLRGEAYFRVAEDAGRPFRVFAAGRLVQAVGTAFTVHLKAERVEVYVTEGTVELYKGVTGVHSRPDAAVADTPGPQERPIAALTAGQNAVFAETVEKLEQITEEDLRQKLLWREGFIAFAGEPLSAVVEEISRYTDLTIEIRDPALRDTPIGGYFKVGDVEGLFEALEKVFDVSVNRVDAHTVHLSRPS